MRPYLFARARDLLRKDLIRKTAETPKSTYFVVKNEDGREFNVEVFYESRDGGNSIFKWKCDCDFMGIQGISNGTLCSHVMAAFLYIGLGDYVETFKYFLRKRHG